MNTQEEAVPLDPEPFLAAMRTALRPEVLLRAGDDLGEVIQAVKETGKKGTLTLRIELTPDDRDPSVVAVTADTTKKVPRLTIHGQLLWPLPNGRLSRKNPAQLEFDGLSAVDGTTHDNGSQEDVG